MGRYSQAQNRGTSSLGGGVLPVPTLVSDGAGSLTWSVAGVAPATASFDFSEDVGGPFVFQSSSPWGTQPFDVSEFGGFWRVTGLNAFSQPVTAVSNVVNSGL